MDKASSWLVAKIAEEARKLSEDDRRGLVISDISGGVASAAGLGFQYLAAIDELLSALEASDEDFILTTEDPADDAIDYGLRDSSGAFMLVAQAKAAVAGEEGAKMAAGELVNIGARLSETEAQRHLIRTNRVLSPSATALLSYLETHVLPKDDTGPSRAALIATLNPTAARRIHSLSDEELRRFWRLEVSTFQGGLDDLRKQIAARIVDFRRRTNGGIGPETSKVLLGYITAEFLHRSGLRMDRVFNRSGAISLLGTSPELLATAAGAYEWGLPSGRIPNGTTIRRDQQLNAVGEVLRGPPAGRQSRHLVLTGLSGIGKSTIARDFAALMSERYDRIVWLDGSSSATIRSQVELMIGPGQEETSDSDAAQKFRSLVGASVASWLIIFDNATSSRTISEWLPATGHVDVIATSTDATAWVQWPAVVVRQFSPNEAMELVRIRLGLGEWDTDSKRQAHTLVEYLGNWPLAIELACAFLAGSGRGLDLTEDYLGRLANHVLDDDRLVPAEYRSHNSLLQAVLVALDTLSDFQGEGLTGTSMLDSLAYLPPRSAPLQIVSFMAAGSQFLLDAGSGDLFEAPTDVQIDNACRWISASSLAHRSPASKNDPFGDSLRANEIVLSIVRELQSRSTKTAILAAAQYFIGQTVRDASEGRRMDVVGAALPSALSVLSFANAIGCMDGEGTTLLGNIASYWSARGEYALAEETYRKELSVLDHMGVSAPRLRAKIFAGSAMALLHLNSSFERIEAAVVSALDALKELSSDQQGEDDVQIVLDGLNQIVNSLERTSTREYRTRVSSLNLLLREIAHGNVPDTYQRKEIQTLLDSPDGDRAALGILNEQLRHDLPAEIRLGFLGSRAEALAVLGRYTDALEAFDEASTAAKEMGLDDGSIRTSTLNGWMFAATRVMSGDDPGAARQFCLGMEERYAGMPPGESDDLAKLLLCLAMNTVERGPFEVAKKRVAALDSVTFGGTHLVKDHEVTVIATDACRQIIRMRELYNGVPVLPVRAWSLARMPSGQGVLLPLVTVGISREDFSLAEMSRPGVTTASWLQNELGVGLFVAGTTGAILWASQYESRWISKPGYLHQPGTERLRQILNDSGRRFNGIAVAIGAVPATGTDLNASFLAKDLVVVPLLGGTSTIPN